VTGVEAGVGQWFGAVADAFRRNFEEPGEEAAGGTVFRGGTKVVDLWAGVDVVKPAPDAPRRLDDGRLVQQGHYRHRRRHVG
jgi:hypothetical protein